MPESLLTNVTCSYGRQGLALAPSAQIGDRAGNQQLTLGQVANLAGPCRLVRLSHLGDVLPSLLEVPPQSGQSGLDTSRIR
jgi:hypothetical protein